MLTALIILPLLAALFIALIPRDIRFGIRLVALAVTLVDMLVGLLVFLRFDAAATGFQFQAQLPWSSLLGISYHVGVDGVNVGLVLMATVVAFTAACVSWEIQADEKEYYVLLMLMIAGIQGAFVSLDLFFFYFFHELALIPTFIMIGRWGRGPSRRYAAFQVTIYLSAGAFLALIGLIALYLHVPQANHVPLKAAYAPATSTSSNSTVLAAGEGVCEVEITPGQSWSWVRGTNDLRLVNGRQVLTNSASFMAESRQLSLVGRQGEAVTSQVINHRSFDMEVTARALRIAPLSAPAQRFIFPLLLFGFGILVSLWPFHTWAPTAYAAAPTATAMLHAGVLKKFGLYGLIRVALPAMPEAARPWLNVLALLCLGNILYCGWVAMRQRDLNLLIGNSSVAHMGFAFLGIASFGLLGFTGALMVMIAHGFLAALTFGLSGYLYRQTNTLEMRDLGGLLRRLPFIGTAMIMAMLAGCGLPGFANFVGEMLVLFATWKAALSHPVWLTTAAAWGGLVIGAVYMLRAIRAVWHGPLQAKWSEVQDAGWWRRTPFVLLLAALLVFGFFPRLLTDKIKPGIEKLLPVAAAQVQPATKGGPAPSQ